MWQTLWQGLGHWRRQKSQPKLQAYPAAPMARSYGGFAEASAGVFKPTALQPSGQHRGEAEARRPAWQPARDSGPAAPFSSTGPHGHRSRLRERLLERGPGALADYEVLEMLLFFAFKKGDTKPLAKALINRFGSFPAVLAAPQQELLNTPGLGEHSVSAIKLVQDAALRLARAEVMDRPVLNNWDRLLDYLNADEAQAKGTVNHTPVYSREVIKRALELHATAVILVHNHPSGDPTPSRADLEMTQEIKQAGMILSVAVHDHLIIGNGRHLSFRREGLL
jgi:DNA repair protein RadC